MVWFLGLMRSRKSWILRRNDVCTRIHWVRPFLVFSLPLNSGLRGTQNETHLVDWISVSRQYTTLIYLTIHSASDLQGQWSRLSRSRINSLVTSRSINYRYWDDGLEEFADIALGRRVITQCKCFDAFEISHFLWRETNVYIYCPSQVLDKNSIYIWIFIICSICLILQWASYVTFCILIFDIVPTIVNT